jgi:hypothetical protein
VFAQIRHIFLNSRINHCTNTEKTEKPDSLTTSVFFFRNWKVTTSFWGRRLRADNVLWDVTFCPLDIPLPTLRKIASLWPKHGFTLRKTALIYFEAPGTIRQTTQRDVSENSDLQLHRCEHLKSRINFIPP